MNIEINYKEIIPLENFELKWRWQKIHGSNISEFEKQQIQPFSESESKRLTKIIKHFEFEGNLKKEYSQTDWVMASSESDEKIKRFRNLLESLLEPWNEKLIITWHRNITLRTNKKIFLNYWNDFLYPISDDVTIISEKTNWIMFYRHYEIANIWTKNKAYTNQS